MYLKLGEAMQVLQVVPRINDEASGPSHSVPALCHALADESVDVELHVTQGADRPDEPYRVYSHGEWRFPPKIALSPLLHRALASGAKQADILHNHSLWCMANVYPGWVANHNSTCRLVTSPRGTLSPHSLKRSRLSKRLMWHLGQKYVLKNAACLHATSRDEYNQIRHSGLTAPIAIVRNGVAVPKLDSQRPSSELRRLLFLGRVHPIKGVELLLQSWAQVQSRFPNWMVEISGPGEAAYVRQLERQASRLGAQRIVFSGPTYGKKKQDTFRRAELFVLPTFTENFGMGVAEALSLGVPAIVTKGAPWSGLEGNECGWWIERDVTTLTNTLIDAMQLSSHELDVMGQSGRAWMQREFSWKLVGQQMRETYEWLLSGGTPPSWVEAA
jgi:glycosyltransferase involved in cell wall biosynthesis